MTLEPDVDTDSTVLKLVGMYQWVRTGGRTLRNGGGQKSDLSLSPDRKESEDSTDKFKSTPLQ